MTNILINGQRFQTAAEWTPNVVEIGLVEVVNDPPTYMFTAYDPGGPDGGQGNASVIQWNDDAIELEFTADPGYGYVSTVRLLDETMTHELTFDLDPDQPAVPMGNQVIMVQQIQGNLHVQLLDELPGPPTFMRVVIGGVDYDLVYIPAEDTPEAPPAFFVEFFNYGYFIAVAGLAQEAGEITSVLIWDGPIEGTPVVTWSGSEQWAGSGPEMANMTLSYDDIDNELTVTFDQDIADDIDLMAFSGYLDGDPWGGPSLVPGDWFAVSSNEIVLSLPTAFGHTPEPGSEYVIDFVDAQIGPDTVAVQELNDPLTIVIP